MSPLPYNEELRQKYLHLSRSVNEEFINIHPLQRGGILTPEAYKALISYGDGYSLCDNCLKGRIDQIESPPVVDFLKDMAKLLNIDTILPTAAARDSKRIVMQSLVKKYPKRRTVILDSLAHYTTYLAAELNDLMVREVPNKGHPEYEIDPQDYEVTIKNFIKDNNQKPLLVVLTHVDYKYGNFNDPKPLSEICEKFEIPFLLNAAYSAGILPIDCKKNNIDFISCSGHKSMAASGPVGLLGFKDEFYDDIIINSEIRGNISLKSFPNKICNLLGCPPVYGAPLITLMASFPSIVKRTQEDIVKEEAKKINYLLAAIKEIKGIEITGKLPKIHPLTNLKTDSFAMIAKTHPRKGFFIREEFKERGIIGLSPGISKEIKFNTYGLTWNQINHLKSAFLDIAEKYKLI
ncbi:MAG: O-phospho-L-seryl-tRNA:Cys-tRNA synthase [Candidatus Thorarchaeota archaeon]